LDKIAGILLISLLAIVTAASISYYALNQPNQTSNTPSPTPTSTPAITPTPSPSGESTEPTSIPKPSVPEFTVKLVDNSYDVPAKTTTEIDQYTGKEVVTTIPGYHVKNKSIEITITNQPLSPYTDVDGYEVNLYYNIRVKGHFGEEWTAPTSFQGYNPISRIPVYSSSGYTVVTCSANYPDYAQLDFQVEAFAGHNYWDSIPGHPLGIYSAFKVDATSGWSETQTITIF
jgi:hypothetical protein